MPASRSNAQVLISGNPISAVGSSDSIASSSAKAETLGIALLDAIESDDPTALIGLPLIRTCALLREAGIDPLAAPPA